MSNGNKLKGKHCALHSLMSSGNYALIKDLSLAKELEETHTLTFIRGKTKWPTVSLLAWRSKTACPKASYTIKFILRAFCIWRCKKMSKVLNLPLCCERAAESSLMPPSNSLAQSASKSESTEQTGFLPASPAQFCSFHQHTAVAMQRLAGQSVHMQEKTGSGPFARCPITAGGTDGKISKIWMHKKPVPLGNMLPIWKYDLPEESFPLKSLA